MEKIITATAVFLFGAAFIALVCALFALPTMLLWDWLMPQLFKLPEVTFWQALGINLLASILFKSSSSKKD